MKKVVLILVAIVAVTQLKAQTSAGNMMVGGNLSFSSTSFQGSSDDQDSFVGFAPQFGYFVSDNLAVGALVGLSSSTNDTGANKTVTNSFAFGPFARYYKFTSNENFAFFGHAQFTFGSGKTDLTPGGEVKRQSIAFQVSPGFAYFFTKHWALDLSLRGLVIESYDPNKDNDNDKETTIEFGLSSFSPEIGIRYHFGN